MALYGEEPFLYSAHYVFHPIALIAIVGEPRGRAMRALIVVAIVLVAVNNITEFERAVGLVAP